jgi:hypothetical protein
MEELMDMNGNTKKMIEEAGGYNVSILPLFFTATDSSGKTICDRLEEKYAALFSGTWLDANVKPYYEQKIPNGYETDKDGNIKKDKDGNPIPKYKFVKDILPFSYDRLRSEWTDYDVPEDSGKFVNRVNGQTRVLDFAQLTNNIFKKMIDASMGVLVMNSMSSATNKQKMDKYKNDKEDAKEKEIEEKTLEAKANAKANAEKAKQESEMAQKAEATRKQSRKAKKS